MIYVIQVEENNGSIIERHEFDSETKRDIYFNRVIVPLLKTFRECNYSVFLFQYKTIIKSL